MTYCSPLSCPQEVDKTVYGPGYEKDAELQA